MKATWLIIDVSNLAYRNFHALRENDLRFGGVASEVLFGVLRDIQSYREHHMASGVVFAFDYGKPLRIQLHPGYKSSRKKKRKEATFEERKNRRSLLAQIIKLRDSLLPNVFSNLFWKHGYEADDVIASVCKYSIPDQDTKIIVSSDHDLYQLLDETTFCHSPHTGVVLGSGSFQKKYDINPNRWAKVKAMAGCSSDDIPGIPGIGEKKAIQFLNGEMNKQTATFKKIVDHRFQTEESLKLTKLPYPDCPVFSVIEEKFNQQKWDEMCETVGASSLMKGSFRGKKKQAKGFGF